MQLSPCIFDVLTNDRVEVQSRTASNTESERINEKRPARKALFTSNAKTSKGSGMNRARGERAARQTNDDERSTRDLINEMKSLKDEVHCLKRSISQLTEQQGELFRMVKSLKKTSEASHFDMGKCCHTENVNRILAQFYCTNGRYPMATDDKKRLLEEEFLDSASGLTVEELMLHVTKYEASRYSYWRSKERRRVLGINGYEHLVKASSNILAKKVQESPIFLAKKVLQCCGNIYNQKRHHPDSKCTSIITI
ncbi:Hypothetical predicted protein [Paramuricea clavata]|uniref:Uncharacterized protein n=1 Tax=Paramuricea clavata TaxID=317549 RepID=A0A6S7FYD5_PARCT|nr:Hypothetical predicted protein [Paramuricea clavata]